MDDPILHDHLPRAPWLEPALWRLPGLLPLDPAEWLVRDEVFGAQMRLRDRLVADCQAKVHALLPGAERAAQECLDMVLEAIGGDPGYALGDSEVLRPDGVAVAIDRARPLPTAGRLTQSDLCLMAPGAAGRVLTGAILCFPSSWTLAEKIGRPMSGIHAPVPDYEAALALRVERILDHIRPGQVLWRANAHLHRDAALFSPAPEARNRAPYPREEARFVRSERQTLRCLDCGTIVFSIHTRVIALASLDAEQRAALVEARLKTGGPT